MIKSLYKCFQHWTEKGTCWIYSDTHFNDEDMLQHFNYPSAEEEVKLINKKVGKNDTIIFLGDVGDLRYIKDIKGYKILIKGNHDIGASKYKKEVISRIFNKKDYTREEILNKMYEESPLWKHICIDDEDMWLVVSDNGLFDEVYEGPLFISDRILLSHEPINFEYALNIHGHDHSGWNFNDNKHLNVCANKINYTPVSLKEIIESGTLKDIDNIHRHTIDWATENRKRKGERK